MGLVCICGNEDSSKFIKIEVTARLTSVGGTVTYIDTPQPINLYACMACGTLKSNVNPPEIGSEEFDELLEQSEGAH